MRQRFKSTSLLLTVILVLGILFAVGCNRDANKEMDLTVELFDRDIPGLKMVDCYQSRFITEKVKEAKNLNVSFITVPRWEDVEKLNVLMAAQTAPDLCMLYDVPTISSYIKQGGLTDLGPALEKYGKNLKKYLGEDVLRYGRWDGIQYTIPGKRPLTPAFSSFVRKDWLDKLGMKIPETREEFYNALVAFKEKNPGNVSNVIPFGIWMDKNNVDWCVHTLVWSFVEDMPDEEFAAKFSQGRWVLPGYKEGIRFLNKLYNEDLINKDFFLDEDGVMFKRELIQGFVGSFISNFDYPYRQAPNYVLEMRKTVPDADLIPFDPFENYEGKHVKMKYAPEGLHMMVPIFHKEKAEAAIKYLDWMASDPSIVKRLQNGELGKHYKVETDDGIPLERINNDNLPNELKMHWHDFSIITTGAYEYQDQKLNIKAQAMSYPGFEDYIIKAMEIANADAFLAPRFDTIIESEAKYTPNLKAKGAEVFVKSITAPVADFDSVYDSLVKEYMGMGAQTIIEEKGEAFKAMKAAEK